MTHPVAAKYRPEKYELRPQPDPDRYVAKKRPCLSCGEKFSSAWIGNRLCHECADLAASRG
jgi:hypothetical protein